MKDGLEKGWSRSRSHAHPSQRSGGPLGHLSRGPQVHWLERHGRNRHHSVLTDTGGRFCLAKFDSSNHLMSIFLERIAPITSMPLVPLIPSNRMEVVYGVNFGNPGPLRDPTTSIPQ